MLLLTNPSLPTAPEPPLARAPLLRVQTITTPQVRPPFALVSAYGGFGLRPGFEAASVPLPAPTYAGRLFTVPFSEAETYTVSAVTRVALGGQLYTLKTDPNDIPGVVPLMGWADTQGLSLYAPVGTVAGDVVTVQLTMDAQTPAPDVDLNYAIDLADFIGANTFTVARAVSEGLSFVAAANPATPQTGELVQVGSVVTLYGDALYRPRSFQGVQIEGVWQGVLPEMTGVLVSFDLSAISGEVVDELTYLGIVCRPAQDVFAVQVGNMFATRSIATVCVPYARALWVRGTGADGGTGVSALGTVSYLSGLG
jgi:hypothetical protein